MRAVAVDDHELALLVMTARLEEAGAVVAAVSSFGDGLAAVERLVPDVVVADYRLGDGYSGVDFVAAVDQRFRSRVVVMSSNTEPAVAAAAWAAGAGAYLLKADAGDRFVQAVRHAGAGAAPDATFFDSLRRR